MTIEITEFRCPTCGHILGEEQHRHAYQALERIVIERTKERDAAKEEQHRKEILQLKEKHDREKESEIKMRIQEQSITMELEHRKDQAEKDREHVKELAEKDRQLEAAILQSDINVKEQIRRAVNEKESQREQENARYKLHIQRLEKDNTELTDKIDEQKRTIENIPPELRGTTGEIVLLDDLHNAFLDDELVPKIVGVEMADVIQTIVTENKEKIAPPIVWDRKMGEKITNADVIKAKKYKTTHNTDFSIIVTEKGITKKDSNNSLIGTREGILLVHPTMVVEIARLLRSFIIEIAKRTRSNEGRISKQAKLYDCLTSSGYARAITTISDLKSNLDDLQRKEEDYHKTTWNTRKESIDEWVKIGERNQQIIYEIIQDQTSDNSEDDFKKEED